MNQEEKIKNLLKRYGASDVEIGHFMKDLADYKDDIEKIEEAIEDEQKGSKEYEEEKENNKIDENDGIYEEMSEDENKHEEYLLNARNLALLRATEEGRRIIRNAPEMPKEELKKAILGILKGEK